MIAGSALPHRGGGGEAGGGGGAGRGGGSERFREKLSRAHDLPVLDDAGGVRREEGSVGRPRDGVDARGVLRLRREQVRLVEGDVPQAQRVVLDH